MKIEFVFAGGVTYTVTTTKEIASSVQDSMANKSTLIWFSDYKGDRVEIVKGNILYVEYKEDN